jgi:hypothetical protein
MMRKGTIRNGRLVPDNGAPPLSGTRVEYRVTSSNRRSNGPRRRRGRSKSPAPASFFDLAARIDAIAFDGPIDLSLEHNHYAYGTAKRFSNGSARRTPAPASAGRAKRKKR